MNLRTKAPGRPGWVDLIKDNDPRLAFLSAASVSMSEQDMIERTPTDREQVIVPLTGTVDLQVGEKHFPAVGNRASVFDGPGEAMYVPAGMPLTLKAVTAAELAIISAPATTNGQPYHVKPSPERRQRRGGPGYEREVFDLITLDHPGERILVGETYNAPGNWSSFPPHKHDQDDPPRESKVEEVYLFQIEPRTGFAFQRVYGDDIDEAYAVEHGDVVAIPRGYHPVSAPPGHQVYYLWATAGEARPLHWASDSSYTFLEEPSSLRTDAEG